MVTQNIPLEERVARVAHEANRGYCQIWQCHVDHDGIREEIPQIRGHEAHKLLGQEKALGTPKMFAFSRDTHQILIVVPRPDKAYGVHIRGTEVVDL